MIVISVLHLCDMFTYIDNILWHFCFESRNIDIGDGIGYDMDRFPTIRERTVYRIVVAKFR